MNLNEKLVIVTGGSSGIGLAMAHAFAGAGASVVITGRNEKKLREAAAEHELITWVSCDVANDTEVLALRSAVDDMGGVDILVNNAGVMEFFDVKDGFPLEKQLQEIEIDAAGPVRLVHHFLPGMMKRESIIVNVSSGLAYVPFVAAPVYSASKAFVHAYTRCLRVQLCGTSVRVIELLPPVVDTPLASFLDPSFPRMPPEKLVQALFNGLRHGNDEITPGQSLGLKWASRLVPNFIFKMLNKG